jgi:hypothetical protein
VKKLFGRDRKVKILRKTSEEAAHAFPGTLDLAYIDGNHSYASVKQDLQLWSSKIRPGGIISGHDYDPVKFPQVIQAVDEFLGEDVLKGPCYSWMKQLG